MLLEHIIPSSPWSQEPFQELLFFSVIFFPSVVDIIVMCDIILLCAIKRLWADLSTHCNVPSIKARRLGGHVWE